MSFNDRNQKSEKKDMTNSEQKSYLKKTVTESEEKELSSFDLSKLMSQALDDVVTPVVIFDDTEMS